MAIFPARRTGIVTIIILLFLASVAFTSGCTKGNTVSPVVMSVPHQEKWGIYELNLTTLDVRLIYSSPNEIYTSALRLNNRGDELVFAQKVDGQSDNECQAH